jgi:hypothetical protein
MFFANRRKGLGAGTGVKFSKLTGKIFAFVFFERFDFRISGEAFYSLRG